LVGLLCQGGAGKDKAGRLKPFNADGVEKSRDSGCWVGKRYGKFNDLIWILGGDNNLRTRAQKSAHSVSALGRC